MTAPTVTRTVEISASADAVFALITDLDTLAALADELSTMSWRKGSAVEPGAVFTGTNRNGRRTWKTRCTITDVVPASTFAFEVRNPIPPAKIARWQYDIAATDTGCRVTESTWDQRPAWIRKPAEFTTGVRDRTGASGRHIEATLQRLKARAESG